jgi:hypothetical protein
LTAGPRELGIIMLGKKNNLRKLHEQYGNYWNKKRIEKEKNSRRRRKGHKGYKRTRPLRRTFSPSPIKTRSYASNTSSTTSSNTSSSTSSTTTTTNGHSKVLEAGQQVKYMTGIAECDTGRFIDPAGSYRIQDGDHQLGDVHVARSAVVFKWNFDKIAAIHNALNSLCSGGVYAENGRKLLLQVDGNFIRADNNLVHTGTILQSRDIQNISLGGIAAPACSEDDYIEVPSWWLHEDLDHILGNDSQRKKDRLKVKKNPEWRPKTPAPRTYSDRGTQHMNAMRSNMDMKELFKEMNQMVKLHYPWLYKFVRRRVFFYFIILLLYYFTYTNNV